MTLNTEFWSNAAGAAILGLGLFFLWRGLHGNRAGERGLLRTRTGMLGRLEGWRLLLFGVVLIGVGASLLLQAHWLLILALGFGFVELLESSAVIAVWRWGQRRALASQS